MNEGGSGRPCRFRLVLRQSETEHSWWLRGSSRQVALFVSGAFLAGAVLAAGIDLYSDAGWDSPILQGWTLIPQVLSAAGLLWLGRTRRSASFVILGCLIGLVVVEEAFHVLNAVEASLTAIATWGAEWSSVRVNTLRLVLVYCLVALVGLIMLAISHRYGSKGERHVVRNLALLLVIAGFFGGPISTLSLLSSRRRWLFIEECGEAVVFALIAGYVAGLVVPTAGEAMARRLRRAHL
jgi:hypothetical protein